MRHLRTVLDSYKFVKLLLLLQLISIGIYAQQNLEVVYSGHQGNDVARISISIDSKLIATTDRENEIKIWSSDGLLIRTIESIDSKIVSLDISADGNLIVAGDDLGYIRIWNLYTGEITLSTKVHEGKIWNVKFGSSNTYILSSGSDNKFAVFDISLGQVISAFNSPSAIDDIDIINGKYIVAAGNVFLGYANLNQITQSFQHKQYKVDVVAFDKKGERFASIQSNNQLLNIWDVESGELIHEIKFGEDYVNPENIVIEFSEDGSNLYTVIGNELSIWRVDQGTLINKFALNDLTLVFKRIAIIVDSTESIMVTTSLNGRPGFQFYEISEDDKPELIRDTSPNLSGEIRVFGDIGMTESNELILKSSGYPDLYAHWEQNKSFIIEKGNIKSAVFNSSKATFNYSEHIYLAEIQNYANGSYIDVKDRLQEDVLTGFKKMYRFEKHQGRIGGVFPLLSGNEFISWSEGNILHWDGATGSIIKTFELPNERIIHATISFDKSILAASTSKGNILVFDIQSGTLLSSLVHSGNRMNGLGVIGLSFSRNSELLLSSNDFGQIRVWDWKNHKGLLDIFPDVRMNESTNTMQEIEWLAITPDGRFEGTNSSMNKLNIVRGIDVLPVSSFFEEYYTPGLIAQVLSGENITGPEVSFSDSFSLPPKVEISSSVKGSTLEKKVIITVKATDQGAGIDEIKLFHNGKMVSDDQRGLLRRNSSETESKTYDINLIAGDNVFTATAFNDERVESIPTSLQITLNESIASSKLYIVSVGINEYRNNMLNLNYGRPDAEAFVSKIQEVANSIFSDIEVVEIYDNQATKPEILSAFESIKSKAKPEDVFVFYYAGHGVMTETIEDVKGDFFIVPYDVTQLYGNPYQLEQKGVSAAELKEISSEIPALKQLMFLDACQSGGAVETFALRGAAEQKAIAQLSRSTGQVVLAAAGSEQFATEFSELGHGVFTYALLEGLKGFADGGSRDGKITVNELSAYLEDLVPELTEKYRGQSQFPNRYGYGQDFPIAITNQ